MADIKSLSTAHQINLVINKLTKATLDELSSSGKLSSELSNQLFMTTDESEGGGGGSADIVYMTQEEYDKAVKDESKYYATPGSGGGGSGSKVQLSCIATEGNDVAVISVDSVPYTLKSGPVGSVVSLSDVKTGGLKVADIAIDGVLSSLNTEALPANSKTQAGIVTKGEGNANKVWATDGSGNPGWKNGRERKNLYTGGLSKTTITFSDDNAIDNFDFLEICSVESATNIPFHTIIDPHTVLGWSAGTTYYILAIKDYWIKASFASNKSMTIVDFSTNINDLTINGLKFFSV